MRHKNVPAARHLMRSAAGFALSLGLTGAMSGVAFAQTAIDAETTETVTTSTAGDVTIGAGGSIALTDNVGPALTVDSDNNVINNGSVTIFGGENTEFGVDNATAVLLQGGNTGNFTQAGTIGIGDNFTPSDTDGDGIPDGPSAQGTGRTGILISGASPFEGNVELEAGSTIVVEGNDSFGINLDNTAMSQGGLTGNLLTAGGIGLAGDNGAAIRVAGDVSGDVSNSGAIDIAGENSNAFDITGDIDGGFINSGTVTNSGFRFNTRLTQAVRDILAPEDLLNGGSVINIEGNIVGGVLLDNVTTTTTDDTGAVTSTTTVTSDIDQFGSAPAIAINGNGTPIAIGMVSIDDATQQFAFINEGSVTAAGVFDDFDATVLSASDVTFDGGISNVAGGTLTSVAFVAPTDLEDPIRGSGIAQVIVLGDQAIADNINNSGVIIAQSSENTDAVFADIANPIPARDVTAVAINIGENATAGSLTNSGLISAVIMGRQGEAAAIRDSSGTLTSVTNLGIIEATGTNSDPTADSVTDFTTTAIDVSNNTSGFTFNQGDTNSTLPFRTSGDILLGSGDDTVTSESGLIIGDIDFAGGDDTLALSSTSFTGDIENTAGLNLSAINDSSITAVSAAPINLTEATFDGTSAFNPILDIGGGTASAINATGNVTFGAGATVTPTISNFDSLAFQGDTTASFEVANAGGDLTVGDLTALANGFNPFIFDTGFDQVGDTLVITLDLRDPSALGLDTAQAGLTNAEGVNNSVFAAFTENLSNSEELANVFTNITDGNAFNTAYNQILPEIGAAARQFILAGVDGNTGAVGSHLDTTRRSQEKPGGAWFQHFAYFADRELAGQSEQFRGDGFGFTGGVDTAWGPFHAVGLNVGFSSTEVEDVVGLDNPLDIVTVQGGAYAGLEFGNLSFSAYGGGGYSDFEQDRVVNIDDFFGAAQGDWSGTHINGSFKAGYDIDLSEKFWIRPAVAVDYLRLTENAYTETGTLGIALDVDERTSDIGSASGVINLGANFQGKRTWIKSSLRAGYKYDFINDPTLTSFRFAGGNVGGTDFLSSQTAELQSFLFPDQGLLLGFSVSAGSAFSSVGFDIDSDIRDGFIRHTGRIVLRLLF